MIVIDEVHAMAGTDRGAHLMSLIERIVQTSKNDLFEDMSSFLLGGRAWTVERVNHEDGVVHVREAPRGMKPSWGGFLPQLLGHELCQRIAQLLRDDAVYPYLDPAAAKHLAEQRADLGALLRRDSFALQLDMAWRAGGRALWKRPHHHEHGRCARAARASETQAASGAILFASDLYRGANEIIARIDRHEPAEVVTSSHAAAPRTPGRQPKLRCLFRVKEG